MGSIPTWESTLSDTPAPAGPAAPKPGPSPSPPEGTPDMGFPAATEPEDMTLEQQNAYYKHHAKKHENRYRDWRGLGLTPDEVKALKARNQELEDAQLSATDKAVKDATEQAKAEARAEAEAELRPKLLTSQLKSAAAPAFTGDQAKLNAWLEGVDPTRFVGDDGDIDEAKVATHLAALVGPPAPGNQSRQWGQHGGPPPAGKPGEGGRAEAERRKERRVFT